MMNDALDPQYSVVVEACAGSGKTWLLASRLIRLLLSGVAPSKILAITYTRKAAAEIEARVFDWLRELSVLSDDGVIKFLTERGLSEPAAREALPQARGLFESVLLADQPMTITTFHGWFVRLVQAAPLTAGLAGYALADASAPLLEEAWARLARRAAREPEGDLARALMALFREPGVFTARKLLGKFIDRRAEWRALGASVPEVLAQLRAQLCVEEAPCAATRFLARPDLAHELQRFAALLRKNDTANDNTHAGFIDAALAARDATKRLEGVLDAFLTQARTVRSRKPSAALEKRLGAQDTAEYFELHARWSADVEALWQALVAEAAYALNRAVLTVGAQLLDELDDFKVTRRVMDFTDLECHADALLASEDAAFLQARLDARYQHILLDEFQDTNPLQWRILRGWFDAYGPGQDAPRVFMVGDPKQSIYRFRRAEPRIFGAAGDYLVAQFGAKRIHNDTTRRNAPAVVAVVNEIFMPAGFREQYAHNHTLPGRVELLPLVGRGEAREAGALDALRNPLAAPRAVDEDLRRAGEAALVARHIRDWVGRLAIADEGGVRPARYDDFMLLTRTSSHLALFERALRVADIPYFSGARGGLLETLEAQDMAALLGFLASPADDLKLAHSLRTPIFNVSDEALIALSRRGGDAHWWQRLCEWADAPPALARARHLLSAWIMLAAHTTVHDVLSAIYTEADVLARYRASVPPLMWPAVRANLEAFMRLSLELDGARYPSLTRFNDELQRLREAADEAPDEGVITGAAEAGRVRILTIHAAKGLEAPLVWLIDADGGTRKEGADVLIDWPPDAHAPTHFSVFGDKASRGVHRQHLFDQEEAAALREDLNLLYVAITRARQYFVASGIEPAKASAGVSFYRRIAAALEGKWGGCCHGVDWPLLDTPPAGLPAVQATEPRRPRMSIGRRREEDSAAQAYGTALHAALELLTQQPPLPPDIEPGVVEHAQRILAASALQRFFDPARYRRAVNEVEYALPDGSSGRIDRLVEVDGALWVLDYKAGQASEAPLHAYRAQLARYRAAVTQLHPDTPVRCALIFGDGVCVELD